MSTARDAGLAALQSGDIQTAIAQLEEAVQENPSDFDACLYLGGAYGQAGRPLDAIKSVTQAVQLQPANAQARYNLAVAMEQGGYAEQAAQVYSQAVHLQPDYPKAAEAIARLHASSNQGFGAPVSASSSTAGSGQQFAETQPQPTPQPTQQFAQPPAFGQQQQQTTAYNPLASTEQQQPAAFNPIAPTQQNPQPTQAFAPPQQSQAFARPTVPVGEPQQPGEAGLGSYMAPPPPAARAAGGYRAPGARPGAYPSMPSYDDEFKMGQAFKDFFRALFKPRELFSEMAGCDTTRSAWALFVTYCLLLIAVCGVVGGIISSKVGATALVIAGVYAVGIIVMLLVTWAVFALIVHMLSRAFGSSLRYGASLRCVVYGAAPYVASLLSTLLILGVTFNSAFGVASLGAAPNSNVFSQTPSRITSSTGGMKSKGAKRSASGSKTSGTSANIGTSSSNPFGGSGMSNSNPFGNSSTTGSNPFGGPGSPGSNPFGGPTSPGANPFSGPFGTALAQVYGVSMLLTLISFAFTIWSMILLGVGISNVHEISGGSSAGVVILSALISIAIMVGVYFILAATILVGVMGMASSMSGH